MRLKCAIFKRLFGANAPATDECGSQQAIGSSPFFLRSAPELSKLQPYHLLHIDGSERNGRSAQFLSYIRLRPFDSSPSVIQAHLQHSEQRGLFGKPSHCCLSLGGAGQRCGALALMPDRKSPCPTVSRQISDRDTARH